MTHPKYLYIERKLKEFEGAWALGLGESDEPVQKTPSAHMARDQVLYLVNVARGLMAELAGLTELTDARDEMLNAAADIRDIADGLETRARGVPVTLLTEIVTELNDKIAVAQESLDGKSLCAGKECKMHCGLGHLQGCEAIKAYLKENGGQID